MTGRRRHEALSELGIFALAYVVYFGVRAVTEGTAAAAMQHAFDLIELEQRLGIAWEQAVQNAVVRKRDPARRRERGLHLRPLAGDHRRRRPALPLPPRATTTACATRPAQRPRGPRHLRALPGRAAAAHRPAAGRHGHPRSGGLPAGRAAGARQPVRGDAELPRRLERPARDRRLPGDEPLAAARARRRRARRDGRSPSSRRPTTSSSTWSRVSRSCSPAWRSFGSRSASRRRRTLVRVYEHERAGVVHRRPPGRERPRAPAGGGSAAAPARRG